MGDVLNFERKSPSSGAQLTPSGMEYMRRIRATVGAEILDSGTPSSAADLETTMKLARFITEQRARELDQ